MTTLAAIDIGSNGARLLIKRFDPEAPREEDRIKKIMFIRIPLRLGKDVFTLGKVFKEREKMMLHMMKGFKQFMKLNDVDAFRACATSAMRDAENGKKLLKKIEKQTGIKLEIIKGQEEAQLLYNNLVEKTDSNEGNFAYIDVGGGSTEVSIIHDGTPERLVTSFLIAISAMRSRFSSKSLSKAIFLGGMRTRLTNGLIFSIRMALKSPTKLPETL